MIPYDKIDPEMRPLIEVMNRLDCVRTIGCCIGHEAYENATVIFKVHDRVRWEWVLKWLLRLNENISEANINIYRWHRLDLDGLQVIDWILEIETHSGYEEERRLEIKISTLERITNFLKTFVSEDESDEEIA